MPASNKKQAFYIDRHNAKLTRHLLSKIIRMTRGFLGLRRRKNRSILIVCEDFSAEQNAKITRQTDYLTIPV